MTREEFDSIPDAAIRNLARAVLAQAGEDYIKSSNRVKEIKADPFSAPERDRELIKHESRIKEVERYLSDDGNVCCGILGLDGPALLSALQTRLPNFKITRRKMHVYTRSEDRKAARG